LFNDLFFFIFKATKIAKTRETNKLFGSVSNGKRNVDSSNDELSDGDNELGRKSNTSNKKANYLDIHDDTNPNVTDKVVRNRLNANLSKNLNNYSSIQLFGSSKKNNLLNDTTSSTKEDLQNEFHNDDESDFDPEFELPGYKRSRDDKLSLNVHSSDNKFPIQRFNTPPEPSKVRERSDHFNKSFIKTSNVKIPEMPEFGHSDKQYQRAVDYLVTCVGESMFEQSKFCTILDLGIAVGRAFEKCNGLCYSVPEDVCGLVSTFLFNHFNF
jgi:hypothetical protein